MVVFTKQTGLTRFAIFGFVHIPGLFVFLRFDVLDFWCSCGASKASGAHSETSRFFRIREGCIRTNVCHSSDTEVRLYFSIDKNITCIQ